MTELSFEEINVGQKAEYKVEITKELTENFAKLSGDNNPLHMDGFYAAKTEFKQPVAHGMIIGALFSRLVGVHLPGKYNLYLSQTLEFHKPIFFGEILQIEGMVEQKVEALKLLKIRTRAIFAKNGEVAVSGVALVKLLK